MTGQQTNSMFDFNMDNDNHSDNENNGGDDLPQLQMSVIRESSHLGTSSSLQLAAV